MGSWVMRSDKSFKDEFVDEEDASSTISDDDDEDGDDPFETVPREDEDDDAAFMKVRTPSSWSPSSMIELHWSSWSFPFPTCREHGLFAICLLPSPILFDGHEMEEQEQ